MNKTPPELFPEKKFHRSKNNVVITGTCAGIAEYLNTDPGNIRVIALLTMLFGGWSIVAYLIASILIPADKNSELLA